VPGIGGGIAGYSYFSGERAEPTAVYVLPPRPPEAKPKPPPPAVNIDPGDKVGLARALQRELKRVGCYSGEITGVWTTSSRMAMRAFTERVNATLPIDKPDPVLLSLVQGHQGDACTANAPPVREAKTSGAEDAAPGPAAVKSNPGAALALTAPGAKAVPKAKADAADEARPTAVKPAPREVRTRDKDTKGSVADAPRSGPVPPEGMREKRPRRPDQNQTSTSQPPKVVRDALKWLGF
jgi:hypothetical protein